jgi:hypothetical protein
MLLFTGEEAGTKLGGIAGLFILILLPILIMYAIGGQRIRRLIEGGSSLQGQITGLREWRLKNSIQTNVEIESSDSQKGTVTAAVTAGGRMDKLGLEMGQAVVLLIDWDVTKPLTIVDLGASGWHVGKYKLH